MDYFIDSQGTKRVRQAVLADWTWAAAPHQDCAQPYLVHNAGYVHVETSRRYLKITIDFERASTEAMVALTYTLIDYHVDVGRMVFVFDGSSVMRQFKDGHAAMDFFVARIADRAMSPNIGYRRRAIPMTGSAREPFRQLLAMCVAGEVIDIAHLQSVLERRFADRYCVVRPDCDGHRLELVAFGRGYEHLDDNWERRRAGTPFGEFNDPVYSTFVQRAYAEAWTDWQPVLEEIDAPAFAQPLPRKYERILLPIMLDSGRAMLSATIADG